MGIKELFFASFILLVTVFPLFFSIEKEKNRDEKLLPDIKIVNGTFKEYSPLLSKEGDFETILYYMDRDSYLVSNFNFLKKDEVKDEWVKLSSKNAEVKKGFVYFKDKAFYFSNEYNLSAYNMIYDIKQKSLQGKDFELFSNKFYGHGDSFVYLNSNIKALNIKYIIKDSK
jgi:hypothetical protein